MYVVRRIQWVPPPPIVDQDEWPLQPGDTAVYGTLRLRITGLVPPLPVVDDEVLVGGQNLQLDDEYWAADLLRTIAQPPPSSAASIGGEDELFWVSADDDALWPDLFFRPWRFKYPVQPILDDDPWTLSNTISVDEDYLLVFTPYAFPVATVLTDDEILVGAVNLELMEDYWLPSMTMMIQNAIQPVTTTDTDVWVVFVPPPPSAAKGLPTLGAGS